MAFGCFGTELCYSHWFLFFLLSNYIAQSVETLGNLARECLLGFGVMVMRERERDLTYSNVVNRKQLP